MVPNDEEAPMVWRHASGPLCRAFKAAALGCIVWGVAGSPATSAPAAGTAGQALRALPLAASEQGRQMLDQVLQTMQLDVELEFLNKTYENDVYVREPITGKKIRTACVRFKATSGFRFAIDPPKVRLTSQELTVEQNIARLEADGLTVKFQLGPCADVSGGFGVRLRDVKLVYKARPTIEMREDGCKVSLNPLPAETRVSIGDLNITGVQNDLDKLGRDAVREALNVSLQNFFDSSLGGGLGRVAARTCGHGPTR
jgi:hypothetical protein